MSRPAIRTAPEVGSSVVVRMPIVVVFPAPFGPSRQQNSPLATWKLIPSTALRSAPRYRLTRPATSIVDTGGSGGLPGAIGGSSGGLPGGAGGLPGGAEGSPGGSATSMGDRPHEQPDKAARQVRSGDLALEFRHEQREVPRPWSRAAGGMLVLRERCRGLKQLLHPQGRPRLDSDPRGDRAGVGEMVDGARRYQHALAWPRDDAAPADAEAHRPLQDGKGLLLLGVGVAARHPAAGREPELPVEHLPAGLRGTSQNHYLLAAERVHDEVWLGHRCSWLADVSADSSPRGYRCDYDGDAGQ